MEQQPIQFTFSSRGGRPNLVMSVIFTGLGSIFLLVAIGLSLFFVHSYSQLQSYTAGQCTITAKQLLQQTQQQSETHTRSNGSTYTTSTTITTYAPDFQFTVQTANGRTYAAHGYDQLNTSSSDRDSEQAIVDQFTVGQTYPCWYNPAAPSQAVLTRQFNWFLLFIPGIFLFIGALFFVIGIFLFKRLP
jgi:hypothetical protein